MQTATGGGDIAAQVAMVRDLGFDGVAWDLNGLAEARAACEARDGDLYSAYAVLDLGDGRAGEGNAGRNAERLAPVRAAVQVLAGGPGMLWLALRRDGKPRDPAGDSAAVPALKALLADAEAANVTIALYPHHEFWLETTDDALALCARLDHPRLGVCFNLCHFLRTGTERDPLPLLRRCGERLFAVTVNGADVDGKDWGTLIRPLGEGTFDLRSLLAALDAVHFAGPVGLQGFGIAGPAREHLRRSMTWWRAAQAR
jgi:sugar phosphate isomerase/epimerase